MITVSAWQLVVVEDVVCLRRSESPATFGFINRVSRESGKSHAGDPILTFQS